MKNITLSKFIKKTFIAILYSLTLSWTSATSISGSGINFDPSAVINDNGNSVVVWTNGTYPDLSIQSSFYNGSIWSPFKIISDTTTSLLPICGIDQEGNAVAIWKSIDEKGQTIMAAQKPIGSDWSLPASLAISPLNTSLSIAVNPRGETIAGWINNEANLIEIANLKMGSSWGSINPITLKGEDPASLRLQIDSTGKGIAVWEESDTGIIFVSQTIDDYTSSWSSPTALTSSGINTKPSFSLASAGNGIIAWTDIETSNIMGSIYENGVWGVATLLSNSYANSPIATTRGSGYFVSWYDLISGNIVVSKNISSIWEYPIILSITASDPKPYNSGSVYSVWVDPNTSEIYAAEYPETGASLSPVIISDGHYNLSPKTSSSADMTIFTWESIVSGDHVIKVNMDY